MNIFKRIEKFYHSLVDNVSVVATTKVICYALLPLVYYLAIINAVEVLIVIVGFQSALLGIRAYDKTVSADMKIEEKNR